MALSDYIRPDLFRPRNLVPAAVAVVVVGGAWFGIRQMRPDEPPPQPQVAAAPVETPAPEPQPTPKPAALPTVLVAGRDIGTGVLLTEDLMEWREWHEPLDLLSSAAITNAVPLGSVVGSMTRQAITAGEPVTWEHLATSDMPGSITALLTPGYRAMTVSVDEATTRAQVIYPGNRVDVILVSGDVPSELGGGYGPASQVIVRDVRVLAVGSATIDVRHGHNVADVAQDVLQGSAAPPSGETYTLELTPLDAERIALATVAGRLTLIVRPFSSGSVAETTALSGYDAAPEPVRFAEVMRGLGPSEEEVMPPPPLPSIRIIRGRGRTSEETLEAPDSATSREAAELLAEALRGGG